MHHAWLLWQLADTALPTGGFVHSGGVEAAYQLGRIPSSAALESYLLDSLEQCGQAVLPFTSASHAAVLSVDPRSADPASALPAAALAELDWECDAFTANHIANRSSRALGNGLVMAASAAFGAQHPQLPALKALLRRERLPGHLAIASGAVCAALGLAREDCLRLALFQQLRAQISSSVRLGIIGPMEAQALQHRCAAGAEAVLGRSLELILDDAATTAPLFDIYQGHHERLYSRLFSS
jgi:urease accessory protein